MMTSARAIKFTDARTVLFDSPPLSVIDYRAPRPRRTGPSRVARTLFRARMYCAKGAFGCSARSASRRARARVLMVRLCPSDGIRVARTSIPPRRGPSAFSFQLAPGKKGKEKGEFVEARAQADRMSRWRAGGAMPPIAPAGRGLGGGSAQAEHAATITRTLRRTLRWTKSGASRLARFLRNSDVRKEEKSGHAWPLSPIGAGRSEAPAGSIAHS
jgi:hypothetical protein